MLSTRIFCGECSSSLIGISANGSTTKVPYYGHGTQAKREQNLTVKGHHCNPFRVPGRKLEERVWKEVLGLIESAIYRTPLYQAIRALSESRQGHKEMQRKEIELAGIGEKLGGLARRITDLPAGVPAEAFYDEMKRLGENQAKLKIQIQEARQRGEEQRIASTFEYDRLLGKLRERLNDISPESKRRIVQALIQKVVVTRNGFELHYFAGVEQIKMGEALASPTFSLEKKNSATSSFKQLNGGRRAIVGEPILVPREYSVQWLKSQVDLVELANFYQIQNWPLDRLASHFKRPRTTIYLLLKRAEAL